MRKSLLGLVLLVATPFAAHAATIDYNLVLNATGAGSNIASGIGDLKVASNAPGFLEVLSGPDASSIQALSFTIGGDTFSLASTATGSTTTFAEVSFGANGALTDIIFMAGTSTFNMNVGAMTYIYTDGKKFSSGTIAGTIAGTASPVPEPSSLVLLGSGFFGLAGLARRKFAR